MDYKTGNEDMDAALEKQFSTLSPMVQQIITSDAIENFTHELTMKWQLSEEEENVVMHEIALVLMNITARSEFFAALLTEALLSPETAEKVASETELQFFEPLKAELTAQPLETTPSTPEAAVTTTEPSVAAPVAPVPSPLPKEETPYVEAPVRKASYGAMLDVPRYDTPAPQPPASATAPTPSPTIGAPFMPPSIQARPKGLIAPATPPTPPHIG